jgi:hypothetical protein
MAEVDLREGIFDDAVKAIRFFNGRLLTASDMMEEQKHHREERKRVGRIAGEGVAYGFEVSLDTQNSTAQRPVLLVQAGLAASRSGLTYLLPELTRVHLAQDPDYTGGPETVFAECTPPSPEGPAAAEGLFVLVVSPVSGTDGSATTSGLAGDIAACNAKYSTRGLQFRLLPLAASDAEDALFRNKTAYRCFGYLATGTPELTRNPFEPMAPGYGLLDTLRPATLTNCDVPLALVHWKTSGVVFVDNWSVRRGVTRLDAAGDWRRQISNRRASEGSAMVLQFQEHLAQLSSSWPTLSAASRFRFLPAAGFLPVGPGQINWLTFLGGFAPLSQTRMSAALFRGILDEHLLEDPIDLAASPRAAIDVYADPAAPAYALFARSRSARAIIRVSPSTVQAEVALKQQGCAASLCATRSGNAHSYETRPGTHDYTLTAAGFQTRTGTLQTTGGLVTELTITLSSAPAEPATPPRCIAVTSPSPAGLPLQRRLCVLPEAAYVPKAVSSKIAPFQTVYKEPPWVQMIEFQNAQAHAWLMQWREYLEDRLQKGLPVSVVSLRILRQRPDGVPDEPEAFAVYETVGLPVLAVREEWTSLTRVEIAKSAPKLNLRQFAGDLKKAGIEYLDQLASAWTGIVAKALNEDEKSAAAIIEAAQEGMNSLSKAIR